MQATSVKDAARLLGVSESAIYRAVERGEWEHAAKIGRRVVVNPYLEYPELFEGETRDERID